MKSDIMLRRKIIKAYFAGVGLVVVLGLVALLIGQRNTICAMRQEMLALQVKQTELARMPAENQLASQALDQDAEIQQLRDNNQALMRLRNEVRTLREQSRELETLRAANARLLTVVQDAERSNAAVLTESVLRQGARLGIVIGQAGTPPDDAARPAGPAGVIVKEIVEDTAAADSDLRPMDIIMAVDGRRITTAPELQVEMLTKQPGQTVALDVMRTGAVLRVEVIPRAWRE